ncbi:MAG: NERD domain-containing protein [Candidatus Heimdallarchaeota archaeon]
MEAKLPADIQIRGTIDAHGAGKNFEQETRVELENEGYEVISNVKLSQKEIDIELDHIAIKDDELTIVSCKDQSDYKNPQKLAQHIKESASVLEHRMNLLNFDNALLFVKVMPKYYENMGNKFSNYYQIKNIKIHIR